MKNRNVNNRLTTEQFEKFGSGEEAAIAYAKELFEETGVELDESLDSYEELIGGS